jgi:phosphonatase-like hydrolase
LWREQIGEQPALASRIDHSYTVFCKILERHFETERVEPTAGCLATLAWLHRWGVPVCLTTGFYRRVTNIILRRLDWTVGSKGTVQYSVTSDEVPQGRPAPDMILRCMELAGVRDPRRVVNVGDTPSDLASGRNAGCGWSLAVTNGTYTKEQLSAYPNDGLLASLADLKRRLTS